MRIIWLCAVAAMMTGTTLEFMYKGEYQPTKANWVLGDFYLEQMKKRGYKIDFNYASLCFSATDFGNFSRSDLDKITVTTE